LTAPPIFQQSEWTCHPELTSAAPFSRAFRAIAKLTGLSRLKEVWEEAGRLDEAETLGFIVISVSVKPFGKTKS